MSAAIERDLRRALEAIVGAGAVLTGADTRPYLHDATEAQGLVGRADAVVLPDAPEQVARALEWCYERGVPVTPRGGGTGYAGGAVPHGGVVIASDRLRRVRSIDPGLWRAQVEAGLTTRHLQRLARENGLCFPVDPGAAEQSQLGGNVATNAAGPHAFKYGAMRAWVTGLEAVVPPGRVIRVGGQVRKDVAGYDLTSLLVGSEGTLAIVTAVDVRLIPAVAARRPVVGFYASVQAGVAALEAALSSGIVPGALEYLDGASMAISGAAFPCEVPSVGVQFVLLAEADGSVEEAASGRAALQDALGPGALGVYAPESEPQVAALWRWREGVSLAVAAAHGGKMSEDIAVPVDRLGEAVLRTLQIGERHGLAACSWGHAGDGNLHSTFMFDRRDGDLVAAAARAAEDLFALAVELDGTISGEHGVGVIKAGWLRRQWPAEAVALHEGVKGLFDPRGLLNPGKKAA